MLQQLGVCDGFRPLLPAAAAPLPCPPGHPDAEEILLMLLASHHRPVLLSPTPGSSSVAGCCCRRAAPPTSRHRGRTDHPHCRAGEEKAVWRAIFPPPRRKALAVPVLSRSGHRERLREEIEGEEESQDDDV